MKYNFTISDFIGIDWKNANIELAYDALEYLPNNEKYEFLKWLAQNYPELSFEWVEEFNEIRSTFTNSENFSACEDFVSWFPERFPEIYAEKFELIERDLCNYYLKTNCKDKLQQRIKFIEKYPVNGIETVTIRLFYQLLYHGMYNEGLNFARKVFYPIYNNNELYGNPEMIFIRTLYSDSLQSTYQIFKDTGNKDFSAIDKLAREFELKQEPEIFEIEKEALFSPINNKEIMDLLTHSKNLIKGMGKTHIYFMRYMLDEYSVPFCLSNIFWEFIANKEILGNSKEPSDFFFIHVKKFDEYLNKNLDLLLETNLLEIFGKVWALPYIYEFLEKHGLISSKSAAKMREYNLYHRNSMLRLLNNDLWQMSFIFSWPQNHQWEDLKPLFDKTFNLNFKEADKIIENYINTNTIDSKVHKEMKENKTKKFKNWHSNGPYQKDSPKIGRNDPCPCGSGKKYKNCCMKN